MHEAHADHGRRLRPCEDVDPVSDDCRDNGKGHRDLCAGCGDGRAAEEVRHRSAASSATCSSSTTTSSGLAQVGLCGRPRRQHLPHLGRRREFADRRLPTRRLDHHEDRGPGLRDDGAIARTTASSCSCQTSSRRTARTTCCSARATARSRWASTRTATPYWPSAYGTTNYFFMVMDNPTATNWLVERERQLRLRRDLPGFAARIGADNPDPDDLAARKAGTWS